MTGPNSRFIGVRGLAAAAAASGLALLMAGCAGDGVNAGANSGGAPEEMRLSATGGGGSAQRGATAWHILGAGVQQGQTGPTVSVTATELAAASAAKVAAAAGNRPRDGHRARSFRRFGEARPALDATSANGLWRREADAGSQIVRVRGDGGVTQSSRGGDAVAVDVGRNDAGEVTYLIGYTDIPASPLAPFSFEEWDFDSFPDGATRYSPRQPGGGNKAKDPSRTGQFDADGLMRDAAVARWDNGGAQRGALFRYEDDAQGKIWLAVSTDIPTGGGTDWLATGIWSYTPRGGASPDSHFGVFADGGDVFEQSRLDGLAGTASYTGAASGIYSDSAQGNALFSANVALTADFDATELNGAPVIGPGVVSGSVRDFRVGGEAIAGDPVVTLGGARMAWTDTGYVGGSHVGRTTVAFGAGSADNGSAWSGRWGGQFFGNADATATGAAAHPAAIAGTFGVSTGATTHTRSLVGAFSARR